MADEGSEARSDRFSTRLRELLAGAPPESARPGDIRRPAPFAWGAWVRLQVAFLRGKTNS